jgi:hypothetical protein
VIRAALAGLMALLAAAPALAAPPYATDDPGVLDRGAYEIIPYVDAVLSSGTASGESGIDANIGVTSGLQLGATVPLHRFAGGDSRFSPGDISLAAKLALIEGRGDALSLSFGPSLAVPTARHGRKRAGADLPLWAGIERGAWSLHGGGGYRLAARRDGGPRPFGGLVVRRKCGDNLVLGSEFHAEGKGSGGRTMLMAGPGLEWKLSPTLTLVAAGHAMIANRATHGRWHLFSALVITP